MNKAVIEVSKLTRKFGSLAALKDVTFNVLHGEMFCIVGPDGAGKTTLMRILCGIDRPTEGSVSVLGFDTKGGMRGIKPLIGYLSQKFSLYRDLTVDENIEFFAEIHGVRTYRDERDRLLEFTRLTPYRRRLAEKLSGGMKQKLALACTLIHTPELLLLDEPSTGVDPVSRRDFWLILSGLLTTGLTIVMTTPYMDEAERASRVAMLDRGTLLSVETPARIRAMMKNRILEIVCNRTRDAYMLLKEKEGSPDIELFGDRLNMVLGEDDDIPDILEYLTGRGMTVTSWRITAPGLENVFITLMKREKGGMLHHDIQ
ncbi:MAG: ABC transporter ATP-binding protein [Spirochaetales bacterium]|nr:ABC transporter ATP-binding protein [Spirochaetales bacterium]